MPEPTPSKPAPTLDEIARAVPGLVRVAAASWWRVVEWGVETTAAAVRDALGIAVAPAAPVARGSTKDELRARGAALLYDSADVWFEDDVHPAYARILDELTPDEARILRFMALEGRQPSIDVRTHRPLGVGSEVVASGLSMIGLQAGVRDLARTNAGLNNLFRLGLIWFSREQVDDPTRYQVVEVQPDVLEALKQAGRSPKIVYRSIQMTPFGEDFVAECLPTS